MRNVFVISVAILLGLSSSVALAQGTEEQRQACQPDAKRFCEQVGFDTARIAQCMGQNYRKLSPGCRQVMRFSSVQHFCAGELRSYCANEDRSAPAVTCLTRSRASLNPNCANAIKAFSRQ